MIETSRLKMLPLTGEQLVTYLEGHDLFEHQLQLSITGRIVLEEVKRSVETLVLPRMRSATGDQYLFHTFWIIIEKNTRKIAAELGFKGPPNTDGEVEIGYGTLPSSRSKGFMTEAVAAVIEWAGTRKEITAILASIDKNNYASIRVVEKNGFVLYEKDVDLWWWKREI